jgi:hypothetical protein
MTTANWLALLATIVGLAATWGALLVRVRIAESSIKDFGRARERQGVRIGQAEERIALLEGASHMEGPRDRTRSRTRPGGIPLELDDGGESGAR